MAAAYLRAIPFDIGAVEDLAHFTREQLVSLIVYGVDHPLTSSCPMQKLSQRVDEIMGAIIWLLAFSVLLPARDRVR